MTPPRLAFFGGIARDAIATPRLPAVNTIEVLEYIKSVFDNEIVLDSVPASAVGNMGAWRAWVTRDKSEVWAERVAAAVSGARVMGCCTLQGRGMSR